MFLISVMLFFTRDVPNLVAIHSLLLRIRITAHSLLRMLDYFFPSRNLISSSSLLMCAVGPPRCEEEKQTLLPNIFPEGWFDICDVVEHISICYLLAELIETGGYRKGTVICLKGTRTWNFSIYYGMISGPLFFPSNSINHKILLEIGLFSLHEQWISWWHIMCEVLTNISLLSPSDRLGVWKMFWRKWR